MNRGGIQVIAAVTKDEYKKHILADDALASRFYKIDVDSTTDEQTHMILNVRMENKGSGIRFEKGIENKIIKKTNELSENHLQPRHAVKVLDLAINQIRSFDINS